MPITVKTENWDSATPPSLPAGWNSNFVDRFVVTDSVDSFSAPNSVSFDGTTNPTAYSFWQTPDSANGNVQVSAYFKFGGITGLQCNQALLARFGPTQTTAVGNASTYFGEAVNGGANPGYYIIAQLLGSAAVIAGPVAPSAILNNIWTYRQLICNGQSIKMRVQRQDTLEWLNASGSWVTDITGETYVISVTDTTVAGAGYAGVGFFAPGAPGFTTYSDNFLFEANGGPLTAGSTYVTGNGATSIIVSSSRASGGAAPYNNQYQRSLDQMSWTNIGTPQTNIDPNVDPDPFTDNGRTTGTIYYYQSVQTDSAGPPATITTPTTSMAPRAAATTYYVSTSGNDSNDGLSTITPWQTLTKASDWGGLPGDTFLFKGSDTFSGSLTYMNIAGTYISPFTIDSYGGGRATIQCGDTYGVLIAKTSGLILKNIVVVGSGVTSSSVTTSRKQAVEVVNPNLTGNLSQIYIDNVEVSGCYSGIEVYGIGLTFQTNGSGFQDVRITNCSAHEICYTGIFVRTLPLIAQDGSSFAWYAYDPPAILGSGANNYNIFKGTISRYVYVGDNVVYHSYGDPLRTDPVHSGDGIMVKSASDIAIERCLVHDSGQNGFGPAGQWIQEVTRGYIRYCETYNFHSAALGVDGDGFDMDGGCVDCVTEYCYSHDNDGAGYLCGPYTGGVAPLRCTIRYCVSERDGSRGLAGIFPYTGANLTIHNCVVYSAIPLTGTTACIQTDGGDGLRIYNNILITEGSINFLREGSSHDLDIQGNVYYATGTWKLFFNAVSYNSLADFITATGYETVHGIVVGSDSNPLLSAINGGTAQLPGNPVSKLTAYDQTNSSPTINTGLDLLTLFNVNPGYIDFHGFPNRYGTTETESGFDPGIQKFGSSVLLPSTGGSGGGASRARLNAGI